MTSDQVARGMLGLLRGLSARAELSPPEHVDVTSAVLKRLRRPPLAGRRRTLLGTSLAVAVLLLAFGWYWNSSRSVVEADVGDPLAELLTSAGLHVDLPESN